MESGRYNDSFSSLLQQFDIGTNNGNKSNLPNEENEETEEEINPTTKDIINTSAAEEADEEEEQEEELTNKGVNLKVFKGMNYCYLYIYLFTLTHAIANLPSSYLLTYCRLSQCVWK